MLYVFFIDENKMIYLWKKGLIHHQQTAYRIQNSSITLAVNNRDSSVLSIKIGCVEHVRV